MNSTQDILQSANQLNDQPESFNEIVLLLALIVFFALMAMEAVKPYQKVNRKDIKSSIVTNTSAFLFNNVIMTTLRATSLFFIAQNFAHFGLLSMAKRNEPVSAINIEPLFQRNY